MNHERTSSGATAKVFGSSGVAFFTHLFATLTCLSCWAIFGPSLALLFGIGGIGLLAAVRPYAPLALLASAAGLGYSIFQLIATRDQSTTLPYRLAAALTALSVAGWTASAAYVAVTLAVG